MSLFQQHSLSIAQLKHVLENNLPVHIFDVRSQADFDQWHIPDSILLPVNEALQATDANVFKELTLVRDHPVVVVCQEGFLSQKAMQQLRDLHIEAYSLEGGIRQWTKVWNTAEIQIDTTKIIQIRRVGKGCLSYMIINDNTAVVIDSALSSDVFINLATQHQAHIKYVLDTHIHADHFSRAKDLADKTDADLMLPDQNVLQYDFHPLKDGDLLHFGQTYLKALHTPGHTDESFSYLWLDKVLFSGDVLFLNGVGRPDLKSDQQMAIQKTEKLYQSLQKIKSLPDETLILPGHFSGAIRFDQNIVGDTLINLKEQLDLLKLNQPDFIQEILTDMPDTPPNFENIVDLNIKGEADEKDLLQLEAGGNRCSSQK